MKSGITLVEVLIVIAVFSIIAGIAVINLSRHSQKSEFTAEVRELISDLHYARQMSITEQIHYGVRFNFDENYYQVIRFDDEEEIVKKKYMPSNMRIEKIDNYYEIKFTLFGAAFRSGKVLLVDGDFSKIVEIKPSGFIHE